MKKEKKIEAGRIIPGQTDENRSVPGMIMSVTEQHTRLLFPRAVSQAAVFALNNFLWAAVSEKMSVVRVSFPFDRSYVFLWTLKPNVKFWLNGNFRIFS